MTITDLRLAHAAQHITHTCECAAWYVPTPNAVREMDRRVRAHRLEAARKKFNAQGSINPRQGSDSHTKRP